MAARSRTTRARTPRPARRLASDNVRSSVAGGIALVITFVALFGAGFVGAAFLGLDRADFAGFRVTVLTYFGFWIGYSLIYLLLTWREFHRLDGGALADVLRESTSARRGRRIREALVVGSGPAGAIGFAAVSIGAVLVVALSPGLRLDGLVVGLAVGVVASSWVLLVTAYAVHYAREEVRDRQLVFPGGGTPGFYDYLYLSVQVSTTFSGSDVSIEGTAMRRTVAAHAVVAFAFNTVIIALLVSVLITGIA